MPTLVIVESPTKAKTISKFLGKGFKVESSFGHIRDLPKSKMGIDIDGGTFEPKYIVSKDKTKQVKKLKDLANASDTIIFATDEDREGEAISWHLAHILKVNPDNAKRIVFHEITKRAIDEALKNPRTIDQKLVDAQQARRVLDRLVGYELSPFLWKKVARGLSAGRVQSVAVRLIVERERERDAFEPQEYWTLEGLFQEPKTMTGEQVLTAKLYGKDGKKLDKFAIGSKEEADTVLAELKEASYTISSIEKKETKRTPPPPFITSTLQQQASYKCGFSAKQTMRLAQQLYEGINIGSGGTVGLITYMRTDSVNLSKQFLDETNAFVANKYGQKYALSKPRFYKKKAKGAQEAHEAVRPTDPSRTPESVKQFLDDRQFKLYELIWKRAVATQMQQARLNKTNIDIESTKTPTYTFRASGQTVVFDGWMTLYPGMLKEEMLPELAEGDAVNCTQIKPEQHFTKPPARYSDATLVKELEKHGIGRPSTYAPTISTIESRGYVERDDERRLKPLSIAGVVTDLLVEHFPQIVDYEFTAQVEEDFDEIAQGNKQWNKIIAEFYGPFHEAIEKKTENLSRADIANEQMIGTDPDTGKPVSARIGRFGPFVQLGSKDDEEKPKFASLPKDIPLESVTLEQALKLLSLPRTLGQDDDGNDIITDRGRFGPYVKVDKTYYSLKKSGLDPFTITLEEAKEVIKEGKEAKAKKTIKEFEGTDIKVLNGPYGAYVTNGKKNARIPKEKKEAPEKLTKEECEELLAKAKPGRRKWKKKK